MTDRPLTQHIDPAREPYDLAQYQRVGGYQSVRKLLQEMTPADGLQVLTDSGLRGRGGAGFPTGMKWSFVPMYEGGGKDPDAGPYPGNKYIVANADEMEPGTFKDRVILEGCPHLLVEGLIAGGFILQATTGYIFIRAEYVEATERLQRAIAECRQAGLLGRDILGSGWSFDIHVHTSAGRYICGEETALLNSLEGKRATPRAKPPFPQISGLWGKPTIVNNVETLSNLPNIILLGADWFKSLSNTGDAGTKLYGVSGRVKRPGCWELPMGTSARELLEEYAGGMADGLQLKTFLPGGGSTPLLLPEHLDTPMDYTEIGKLGSRLGTGTMIVIDDQVSLVAAIKNLEHFFAQESCGFCTPCRDGLPWVEKTLDNLLTGRGTDEDIAWLDRATQMLNMGNTFCAHAPGAMGPLESALKYFRADFEALVSNQVPSTTHRAY